MNSAFRAFLRAAAMAVAPVLGLILLATVAAAQPYGPGASDTSIKIGHINPYSGPASAYGTIGRAVEAYWRMVNDQGGINGRQIDFITYDDGYSPPKTVEQARRLVEQDQVLFIFQSLGTPTNTAIHQYMNQRKVPHLFVATGATKWGQPEEYPWTMGWQPTYQTESKIYAQYILNNVDNPKIGVLYQNDDYGKDYLTGLKDGLGARASDLIVSEQSYEVTEPTVNAQIVTLKNSGANVFVNITTPKFAAQAIKHAHEIGWDPVHFLNNVSNSVASVLEPAGLDASTDIISSEYLKDQDDPRWQDDPEFKGWLKFMRDYHPEANIHEEFNVYGYAVSFTLHQVLKQAGDNLTRENVMKEAANINELRVPMLLPNVLIDTGPKDYYPIECEQLMRFDGSEWVLFGDVICAETPDM